METEKMKMKAGKLYDANYDKELLAERAACADLTYELNQLRPSKAFIRQGIRWMQNAGIRDWNMHAPSR